jgi:hypothetical protein
MDYRGDLAMRFIYDLDHTVIDSSHRQATLADGSLDLAHWIENNTPEKIARDSLLPLAKEMRENFKRGAEIVVCTARVLQDADYEFLRDHGLHAHAILSRPMGDSTPDWLLKDKMLRQYARRCGISWARLCATSVMLDDNANVIVHLNNRGLTVYDAIQLNKAVA